MKRFLMAVVVILSASLQSHGADECQRVLRHSSLQRLIEVAPQYRPYENVLSVFTHWIEDSVSTPANHQGQLDQGEYWIKAHLPWTDQEHLLISLHVLVVSDARSHADAGYRKYHPLIAAAVEEANLEASLQDWSPIYLKDFPMGVLHAVNSSIPMLTQTEYRWVWMAVPAHPKTSEDAVRPTQMKLLEILSEKLKALNSGHGG